MNEEQVIDWRAVWDETKRRRDALLAEAAECEQFMKFVERQIVNAPHAVEPAQPVPQEGEDTP
jgi:hypothetical protein